MGNFIESLAMVLRLLGPRIQQAIRQVVYAHNNTNQHRTLGNDHLRRGQAGADFVVTPAALQPRFASQPSNFQNAHASALVHPSIATTHATAQIMRADQRRLLSGPGPTFAASA
jgi:phospholipase/lecithinase/hemolysin